MEIRASSVFDEKTITAFAHAATFKRRNPKKQMIGYLSFVVFFMIIGIVYTVLVDSDLVWCVVVLGICGFVQLFLYFVYPNIQYSSLGKLKGTQNEFIFGISEFTERSKNDELQGESTVKYSAVVKAYETKDYLFVFQTKVQAYIVDKSTLSEADMNELRSRLSAFLGKKYMICKY